MNMVYLIWRDHFSDAGGWVNKQAVRNSIEKAVLVHSAGILIDENKNFYAVALNHVSNGDVGMVMNILKSTVIYKRLYKIGAKK